MRGPATESALVERWNEYRAAHPRARQRDAAQALGVSEAELVAAQVGAATAPLQWRFAEIFAALPDAGKVMALTRNDHAVSEVNGRYGGVAIGAHGVGQVSGEHIELRLFLERWASAFAVCGARPSVQFFDAHGTAVHKIFFDDMAQLTPLVERFALTSREPFTVIRRAAEPAGLTDDAIDVPVLRRRWDGLTDTHDFFPLLRELRLTRTQALRLAGRERAVRVADTALETVLRRAAASGTELMVFVGNRGCIQIRSGSVANIVVAGKWLNVLDPGFNLHVDTTGVASSWVVRKPTRGGMVTSLEVFDAAGGDILYLFQKRHDRERPETGVWQELLAGLEEE